MVNVSFDFETFEIGPEAVAPRIICGAFALRDEGKLTSIVYGNGDEELLELFQSFLTDPNVNLVGQFTAFDMGCAITTWPQLTEAVFAAYEQGRVRCTRIREQLLNLSTSGSLTELFLPDGSKQKLKYNMAEMAKLRLGKNIFESKEDADSWRKRYALLHGKKVADYPDEAVAYVRQDAEITLLLYEDQVKRIEANSGPGSCGTDAFQAGIDFTLYLATMHGIAIDEAAKEKVEAQIKRDLAPSKLQLLVDENILIPGTPPRPYANKATNPDGTPKMTKGTDESINKKRLKALIEEVCTKAGVKIQTTEKTGQPSTASEFLAEIKHLHPAIALYRKREAWQKVVTTELPRMNGTVIHPRFNVLVRSGRTSSYADDLFPSANIQQIDPRVRPCYVPRPGTLLASSDYDALELCTLAQKIFEVKKKSFLRDIINRGDDPHAYLGAQIAYTLVDQFRDACRTCGLSDTDDIYAAFREYRYGDKAQEHSIAFFKQFRTMAKPTGLGFPGGLGPETFVAYAKSDFGVDVSLEVAFILRDLYFKLFPEVRDYLSWIEDNCGDPRHAGLYAFSSPLGMYRAACYFTSAANGVGLQTRAAEGAKLAFWNVSRACYDASSESILFGCRPVVFLHDEIILEVHDTEKAHDEACELSRLMVESMREVVPDVKISASPVLMRRWDKRAEPCFDGGGRLIPWEPENAKKEA